MGPTENRYCKECGKETSEGSMYYEHYNLDEFYCTGKTTKYDLRLPDGSKVFIMDGGDGTTEAYMKKHGKRMKVSVPCDLYYCGDCAEELDYECTTCGSPLKIGGTPFSSKRRVWLSPIVTKERSIFYGMEGKVSAVNGKYFIIEKDWFKDKRSVIHDKLTRKFAIDELDFGDNAKKARMVLEGKLKLIH